jgi:GNAT superfamily N-acetyltransferase
MRAYCVFYEQTAGIAQVSDDELESLAELLLADPEHEGVQLLARRTEDGAAVGFATVYWSRSTLSASKLAVMNDLFVDPSARGGGIAEALIEACREVGRAHGAATLGWQTAKDNARAQAVYDRVGGSRSEWIDYSLPID